MNRLTHQEESIGGKKFIVLPYSFATLGLSEIDIKVFFKLAQLIDETDTVTIPKGEIAQMIKHSRLSVVSSLKKMERMGLIKRKKLWVDGVLSRENKYELYLPEE